MPILEIKYVESITDTATGQIVKIPLGIESYDGIEESLLPKQPSPNNPIFITKKFVGHTEYRWEVNDVLLVQQVPVIFEVTLLRHNQLQKGAYLPEILRGKSIMSVLQKYSIVEVEFGHAPQIVKATGDIRSNKRYIDTVQEGNMPKRRLAIVLRASHKRPSGAIVQVVPISSKQPHSGDKTTIEITNSLVPFHHYNKQSWAICGMVESVSASRIIAPMVNWGRAISRDTGFSTKLHPASRQDFELALLHGLDRATWNTKLQTAITANTALASTNTTLVAQNASLSILNAQLAAQLLSIQQTQQHAKAHEAMARELASSNHIDFVELRDAFS